jgi:hypothetical protein
VRHVFDRGSGTAPWLWQLCRFDVRFVVRWKEGNKLLDEAGCERKAWEIAFSYVSRWKIEEHFRFQKTELLIESLRLRNWEPRRKLLLLVTLAYGFLLSLLLPASTWHALACCSIGCHVSTGGTGTLNSRCIDSAGRSVGCGSLILPLSRHLAGGPIVPPPISLGRPVQSTGG